MADAAMGDATGGREVIGGATGNPGEATAAGDAGRDEHVAVAVEVVVAGEAETRDAPLRPGSACARNLPLLHSCRSRRHGRVDPFDARYPMQVTDDSIRPYFVVGGSDGPLPEPRRGGEAGATTIGMIATTSPTPTTRGPHIGFLSTVIWSNPNVNL